MFSQLNTVKIESPRIGHHIMSKMRGVAFVVYKDYNGKLNSVQKSMFLPILRAIQYVKSCVLHSQINLAKEDIFCRKNYFANEGIPKSKNKRLKIRASTDICLVITCRSGGSLLSTSLLRSSYHREKKMCKF